MHQCLSSCLTAQPWVVGKECRASQSDCFAQWDHLRAMARGFVRSSARWRGGDRRRGGLSNRWGALEPEGHFLARARIKDGEGHGNLLLLTLLLLELAHRSIAHEVR